MKLLLLALALIAAAPIAVDAQTPAPAPPAPPAPPPEPRSCQRLHEETNKCEAGMRSCNQHLIARLEAQCQRDEKRLPQVLGPHDAWPAKVAAELIGRQICDQPR